MHQPDYFLWLGRRAQVIWAASPAATPDRRIRAGRETFATGASRRACLSFQAIDLSACVHHFGEAHVGDAMPDLNLPCIYCWGRSGDPSFSLEHIWPQSLGGAFMPDLFKTDQVCKRCNSLAGQFVDGAFLKSWFLAAENTSAAHRYLDKDKPSAMPLFYHGVSEDFPCAPEETCERWIGPSGDHIYHIHTKDDDRWDTFAGGDVIKRNRDPGRAYMALTSEHPYWFATSALSFLARFEGARHRLLSQVEGLDFGPKLLNPFQEPISDVERDEVNFILNMPNWQSAKVPMQIDFAERFLCKLAIGLAYKALGHGVMETPYVTELRRGLWTTGFQERQTLRVRGKNFWSQTDDQHALDMLHWSGAWVISLNAFPDGFAITVITPGGRHLGILATEGHKGWAPEAGPIYSPGQVYLVVPQRQTVVGPLPMTVYSSFKAGLDRNQHLEQLRAMETQISDLPPKR